MQYHNYLKFVKVTQNVRESVEDKKVMLMRMNSGSVTGYTCLELLRAQKNSQFFQRHLNVWRRELVWSLIRC